MVSARAVYKRNKGQPYNVSNKRERTWAEEASEHQVSSNNISFYSLFNNPILPTSTILNVIYALDRRPMH